MIIIKNAGDNKMLYKLFSYETEWSIFQNIIATEELIYTKSKSEKILFHQLRQERWIDNTDSRPDFVSEKFMIELFEVDDIVTSKKGSNNPQRKADARALRTVEEFMKRFPAGTFSENVKVIAHGDTRYNPLTDSFTPDDSFEHHNYEAYLNNFKRITQKHLDSVSAYRTNFPDKKLGFMILDDSTYYVLNNQLQKPVTGKQILYNLSFFDKNFMKLFIKSDVDFIVWAFDNKYIYTNQSKHGQGLFAPKLAIIEKENFYTKKSKYFQVDEMVSLEE